MPDLAPVGRALLSVSDKTDLIPFARALESLGVELISTGGTAGARFFSRGRGGVLLAYHLYTWGLA